MSKVMCCLALLIVAMFALDRDACISAVHRAGSAVRFAAVAAADALAARLHL